MGNRISIQFRRGEEKSAILNSHWGGKEFLKEAKEHVKYIKKSIKEGLISTSLPLGRLDPDTLMVDFVRAYTKNMPIVDCNLRLVCTEDEIDNSDNGHHIIELRPKEKQI